MEHKRRMLAGEIEGVLDRLGRHACEPQCQKDEHGKCLVRVAERYITNNRAYMEEYEDFMVRNLPVGSGEAESGIRHVIKRRMSVAGAWKESNAALLLALVTIRASGWWDDFWSWRRDCDKEAWHARQRGEVKAVFRSKRRRPLNDAVAA
jgi:hypothetical protein